MSVRVPVMLRTVLASEASGREGLFPLAQRWFWIWLAVRLGILLVLGHWYDLFVFREISERLASGNGVYAISHLWLAEQGEGYFVYPPVYAYALALAGLAAKAVGGGWYVHHLAIKLILVAGDLTTFAVLRSIDAQAARRYWTLWFVPLLAIAQIQPDLWVGLTLLLAYLAGRQERWSLAGLLIGLGSAIKFTPAVTIPFVVIVLWQRGAVRSAAVFTAYAVSAFIAAWLPYLFLYRDAWQFGQVLAFHQARLGGGLSLITPISALYSINQQLGGVLARPEALLAFLRVVSQSYIFMTATMMLALLVAAIRGRWGLERILWLPMVAFLASTKLVNEQYLLQILPLGLVVAPEFLPAIVWPFTLFVLAAGTPLRFLPREINPVDFADPAWAAPAVLMALRLLMAGAAILFTFRMGRLALSGRPDRPQSLRPLIRHVPLGLAVLTVLVLLGTQRPRATAIELTASPEAMDTAGTGAISLIRVHARNRGPDPLDLSFTVGFHDRESVWIPAGGDTISVRPGTGRTVLLQPREFDHAVPLGVPFRVRAVAPRHDLAAETWVPAQTGVPWSTVWRIPGIGQAQRSSGTLTLTRGVQERAGMGVRCVEGRLALQMSVRRTPASRSEWTVAEIQQRLDATTVRRLLAEGLELWVYRPLEYAHQAGWPTAAQSLELRGPGGSALTIAFSATREALYDLSPTRRVLVVHVPGRGWTRLHLWIGEDARDVGLRPGEPWILAASTAAQRQKPGVYEGIFGLMDPGGRGVPCETEGGK